MDVAIAKDLGMAGGQALDKRARHLYGANCHGVSWHGGNPGQSVPPEAKIHLLDGQDPANADTLLAAIDKPVVALTGLNIQVDLGTLIVNDDTLIAADPTEIKMVKVSLVKDNTSGDLEVVVYEKTTGEYGAVPGGKTHVADLKEYSLAAAGTELVEVQSWL